MLSKLFPCHRILISDSDASTHMSPYHDPLALLTLLLPHSYAEALKVLICGLEKTHENEISLVL